MFPIWLRVVFSLIIIVIVFSFLGFDKIYVALLSTNIFFSFLAILLLLFNFFVASLGFKVLLDPITKISYKKIMHYYALSWVVGFFTPGRLGDAFIIKKITENSDLSFGKASAIFLIQKILTIILMCVCTLILVFSFYDFVYVIMFLLGILFFVILAKVFPEIGFWLTRKFLNKYEKGLVDFHFTFKQYFTHYKKQLVLSFLISFLYWLIITLVSWILFYSFGTQINFLDLFVISTGLSLLTLLPFTFSGIGPREALLVFFLSKFGISLHIIGAVTIISIGLNFIIWCILTLSFAFFDRN